MLGAARAGASIAVASVIACAVFVGTPLQAVAASPNYVITMFSDNGDFVGQGAPNEFDSSNESVTGTATSSEINISINGGTTGTYWTFDIAPPPGGAFRLGYYAGAQRTPFRTAGHPGIDIYGEGRGCNTTSGGFEVRRLAYANGSISRLDLLYEQHCEAGTPALFGEIRLNDPQTTGLLVSSSEITWPYFPLGENGTTVPVYIRNLTSSPAGVGAISISGSDPGMFSLVDDGCSGHVLATMQSCLFFIAFKPTARGPRNAHATIPIGSTNRLVWLAGLIRPGSTYLTMNSQAGDFIGQGETYNFTPANAQIGAAATTNLFYMGVQGVNEWWTVYMQPGNGQVLAPGFYPNAGRYQFTSGNGLEVTGDGRGCNTLTGQFTIYEVVISPVDNRIQNFKATFTQHCEGAAPALTGGVGWNAEPVTAAPPNVSNFTATASGSTELLSWTNPTYSYYAYTVVRWMPGTPRTPVVNSGWPVTETKGTSAGIGGLAAGAVYTASAFTVDVYGNVSSAESLTFTAA